MKIRFLYHKPKGESVVGRAIVGWTWFLGFFYNWKVLKYNYSHEEIWLPDEKGEFGGVNLCGKYRKKTAHQILFKGECLSSTTRGDNNGVRFADANIVLKHPERWDYIEVDGVDPSRVDVALDEAEIMEINKLKYDYWAIFGFVNPFPVQDENRWYCSELCDWFKYLCRITQILWKRISPRRSAYLMVPEHGEPIPLIKIED